MGGHVRGVARPAVLSLLVAVLPAAAQVPREATATTIPVGPVLLQPFFLSSMERTDNVFQRQGDDREAATVSAVTPGFLAQLPFSHSHAFLGYAVRWEQYDFESFTVSDEDLDPFSHYVRAQTRLLFGSGWFVMANEDFSRGVIDTQEFQGGEVRFSGEKMQTHHLTGEVGIDRGPRRRLKLALTHISDRIVGERHSNVFDTLENRAALEGEHQKRAALSLSWAAEVRDGTRSREGEERVMQEGRLRVGGRWRGAGGRELDVMLGVANARFPRVGASDANVVGSAGIRFPFDRTGVLAARLGRDVYPSVVDDIYFISNSLQFEVASDRESRIGLGTSATLYANTYPATGRGKDDQLALETWIGYRFGRWLEGRLTFRGVTRNSTTEEFDYDERTVAVQFRLGAS